MVLSGGSPIVEFGDLLAEIERQKNLARDHFPKDSATFVTPTADETADFSLMVQELLSGDLREAADSAAALDYELVEFHDTNTGNVYYQLREQLDPQGSPTRGWGTYVVNLSSGAGGLIEVPHPLHDLDTWDVGARTFLKSEAFALLVSGAHRDAFDGEGFGQGNLADPAHLEDTIFHAVHTTLTSAGGGADVTAWQIHGFVLLDEHPEDTQVILSNGDVNVISEEVVDLDSRFDSQGWASYAFNRLDINHPLNELVNQGPLDETIDGNTFVALGARTNVQGQFSRAAGSNFVHVELARDLRQNFTEEVASLIASAVRADNQETGAAFQTEDGIVSVHNWAYALQGSSGQELSVDELSAAPHDLVVMDYAGYGDEETKFTPAEIADIKNSAPSRGGDGHRKVVASYISIGEASEFRAHWDPSWTVDGTALGALTPQAPAWLGPNNPDWNESRKVRYWDPQWQEIIFNDERTGWLDQIVDQGFDAAYLDIVDAYYYWVVDVDPQDRVSGDPDSVLESATSMIDFIVAMTNHARESNPYFFVIPQNGEFILDAIANEPTLQAAYLNAIGAIGIESTFFRGGLPENNPLAPDAPKIGILQSDFLANGIPVLSVDYVNDETKVKQFYELATAEGFIPFAAPSRALDAIGPMAPPQVSLFAPTVEVVEGNEGTTPAVFELRLTTASTEVVVVDYATSTTGLPSPATAGEDYIQVTDSVTFQPGETSKLVTVSIVGDLTSEGEESLGVTITGASGALVLGAEASTTIKDNDTLWHNENSPNDINADGQLDVLDAVVLINELLTNGIRTLPLRPTGETRFLDPNNDGVLDVLDAVVVINALLSSQANSTPVVPASVPRSLPATGDGDSEFDFDLYWANSLGNPWDAEEQRDRKGQWGDPLR